MTPKHKNGSQVTVIALMIKLHPTCVLILKANLILSTEVDKYKVTVWAKGAKRLQSLQFSYGDVIYIMSLGLNSGIIVAFIALLIFLKGVSIHCSYNLLKDQFSTSLQGYKTIDFI